MTYVSEACLGPKALCLCLKGCNYVHLCLGFDHFCYKCSIMSCVVLCDDSFGPFRPDIRTSTYICALALLAF